MSDHYASGRARARESVGYADEHARTAQAHLAAATEEDLQNIARMKESFMSAALPGSGDGGPSLPALLLTPQVLADEIVNGSHPQRQMISRNWGA